MSEPIQTIKPGYLNVSDGAFNMGNLRGDQLSASMSLAKPVVELKLVVDGKLYTIDQVKAILRAHEERKRGL